MLSVLKDKVVVIIIMAEEYGFLKRTYSMFTDIMIMIIKTHQQQKQLVGNNRNLDVACKLYYHIHISCGNMIYLPP